jgi:hypothetical protein
VPPTEQQAYENHCSNLNLEVLVVPENALATLSDFWKPKSAEVYAFRPECNYASASLDTDWLLP